MIAVPVDSEASTVGQVSEYFGDVAFFQLYGDDGKLVGVLANKGSDSGQALSTFLATRGVTQVLFRHLGDKLFGWLSRAGIESYAVAKQALSIEQALDAHLQQRLERVDKDNHERLLHPAGPGTGKHCEQHD